MTSGGMPPRRARKPFDPVGDPQPKSNEPRAQQQEGKQSSLQPGYQMIVRPPVPGVRYHEIATASLPSRGLPYPGLDAIPMAVWTTEQVERLSEALTPDKIDGAILECLADCSTFDPAMFTIGDVQHILYWHRVQAYGKFHDVRFTDDDGVVQRATLDITTLEHDQLNESWTPGMVLEVGGAKAEMDLERYKDQRDVDRWLKMSPMKPPRRIVLYASTIMTVNGEQWPLTRKVDFVRSLPPLDFKKIQAYHEHFRHGVREWCEVTHPRTQERVRLRFPFQLAVIIPDGIAVVPVESQVVDHEHESGRNRVE